MQTPDGFDPRDVTPPPLPDGVHRVRSIALDVAGRCNLACRYCVEAATQPARPEMSTGLLEVLWDWFRRERPPGTWSVHLGSGEPLLAAPLLARLDARVRAEPCRPQVFLTTNGTLVDDATADWLAGTQWDIKVSVDGPEKVNDRWRVTADGSGTCNTSASAVRRLAARLAGHLTVASVLCRGTDPFAVHEFIATLGARRLEVLPVETRDPDTRLEPADLARYRAFIADHARRRAEGEAAFPLLARFERCVAAVMGYRNRRVPCTAGRGYVGIGADGALYPCLRFVGLEGFRIGQLPDGLDPAAILAFQAGAGRCYEQREACAACWAAPLCGGPCFVAALTVDLTAHCEIQRADAAAAVWLVHELRRRDPRRLFAFLQLRSGSGEA